MRHAIVLAATAAAFLATAAAAQSPTFPPNPTPSPSPGAFPAGPGHDIVAQACTQCHSAKPIVQLRMGEPAWRRQVQNMVLRGAQIGPGDLDTVSAYLADKFGPGVPLQSDAKPMEVHLASGGAAPIVEGGCALCHGLDRVTAVKRPAEQWPAIVHRMVELGAPLDAEQTGQVIDYLKANYVPARS